MPCFDSHTSIPFNSAVRKILAAFFMMMKIQSDNEAKKRKPGRSKQIDASFFSDASLARRLEISPRTVKRWRAIGLKTKGKQGLYPWHQFGAQIVRIPESSVVKFLAKHECFPLASFLQSSASTQPASGYSNIKKKHLLASRGGLQK